MDENKSNQGWDQDNTIYILWTKQVHSLTKKFSFAT